MSMFHGAVNTTINGGIFNIVANTVAHFIIRDDVVALLHSHGASAGLLDAKERFQAPKCDEGTRISMMLGMKQFVQDGDAASSPALYWLHGPAGVGKSALAQSLSLLLQSEGDHAASFFFSRNSPDRNNGNQLIATLAYQLAINFPALRRVMSKAVQENPAIFTASNTVQMQSLIIDPINKWHRKYMRSIQRWTDRVVDAKSFPRLILVDGLDECKDPKVQTDLILCIASAVRQLAIPLRFVITSRTESHILAAFELNPVFQGLDGVKVTKKNLGDDDDVDKQITTFLLKQFAEIRRVHPIRHFLPDEWPRLDQIEQLVSKSSRGFIYPATVIRYIGLPDNRPVECLERILGLSEIPTCDKPYQPLDLLYHHIFQSVPAANRTSVSNIFHFLVLPSTWDGATNPLTIERNFGFPPGHVLHVLRDLLCLVEFSRNGHIKLLHASLPDFLLDESRSSCLYIEVSNAHSAIAASYILDIRSNEFPVWTGFAYFLEHLMQANLSDTLLQGRLLEMDLLSQYKNICLQTRDIQRPHDRMQKRPSVEDNEGVAYMTAYLLVLVIRQAPHRYITRHTAAIKAYLSAKYPFSGASLALHNVILPAMTPLFRGWIATTHHECINRVFASEVAPSQNAIREAIFSLHSWMMVHLCDDPVFSDGIRTPVAGFAQGKQTEELHLECNGREANHCRPSVIPGDPKVPVLSDRTLTDQYVSALSASPAPNAASAWDIQTIFKILRWLHHQRQESRSQEKQDCAKLFQDASDNIYRQLLCVKVASAKACPVVSINDAILSVFAPAHTSTSRQPAGAEDLVSGRLFTTLDPTPTTSREFSSIPIPNGDASRNHVSDTLLLFYVVRHSLDSFLKSHERAGALHIQAGAYHTQLVEICLELCRSGYGSGEVQINNDDSPEPEGATSTASAEEADWRMPIARRAWVYHLERAQPTSLLLSLLRTIQPGDWLAGGSLHRGPKDKDEVKKGSVKTIIKWLRNLAKQPADLIQRWEKIHDELSRKKSGSLFLQRKL